MARKAKLDRNFDFSKLPNFASNCIHCCLHPLILQETFEKLCHSFLSHLLVKWMDELWEGKPVWELGCSMWLSRRVRLRQARSYREIVPVWISDADPPYRPRSVFPLSWLNKFTGTTDPRTLGAITNFLQNWL